MKGESGLPPRSFLFMEHVTSRKNAHIARLRALAADGDLRRETGELVLSGVKLLREAMSCKARVTAVLWADEPAFAVPGAIELTAPEELLAYASPLKTEPGPVFSAIPAPPGEGEPPPRRVLVLESVQDPGNVGTAVRTADALGTDAVILTGDCADLYSPRCARATMGAVFRQRVLRLSLAELAERLKGWGLPLYGAALRENACDIRTVPLGRAAVAVGNEGRGLSEELLALCDKTVIIPISPDSESLNAAMAAAIIMWEMAR